MDTCFPLSPVLFALVLQAARLAPAEQTPTQDLTYKVGDTASLLLQVPQRSNISSLIWRSFSRSSTQAVATWSPEDSLNVLSPFYARRVIFHKHNWTLEIHNLSKTDGGPYEAVESQDPSDVTLMRYTLVVFEIETTVSSSGNGSCSLTLGCSAGAGVRNQPVCSWGPGHEGSTLHLTLHPDDKRKAYTCTATVHGAQYSHEVTPYHDSCSSAPRAAGLLGAPALLLALLLRWLLLL